MNETPKTNRGWRILHRISGKPVLFFTCLIALSFIAIIIASIVNDRIRPGEFETFIVIVPLETLFVLSILGFILSLIPRTRPFMSWLLCDFWISLVSWQGARRILIGLAVLATLIAIFYTEEDWRGKRAWENCKRELEAKGAVLDWDKYIPPPVPDDQNFFTASTNILLRFKKVQTDAESKMVSKISWLHIDYSTNSFPVFDTAKTKPLVVAEMTIEPSGVAATAGGSHSFVVKFDAAGATEQVRGLIRMTVGRGVLGAAGFQFSERQLSNLAPEQIILQSDTLPSEAEVKKLIPEDLVTNIGHLRIEAVGDQKSFRVVLTGVHVTSAADYLKWSDQFVPAFDEIREALKRPYALIPGDYSQPYLIPIPNFIIMRSVAQTLAQRAQCHLLLGQPDQALREVTLMCDVCRILEKPPTEKPETLVEAMINVAIMGLYANTIADGLHWHAWQEPQILTLQNQLAEINLTPFVSESLHEMPAAECRDLEIMPIYEFVNYGHTINLPDKIGWWLWPRGWTYQNMANIAALELKSLDGFDLSNDTIAPHRFDEANREVGEFVGHGISPYNILAANVIPNVVKAEQVTAHYQSMVNEAQIACALERYRLANGADPDSLDALVPRFIEKLPHDIINGQPLIYRPTADGKFLLYSIGWDEKDDGGQESPPNQNGGIDYTKGDWVWKN